MENYNKKTSKKRKGILFVHGIGEQRIGEMLVNYGDPLIDYLDRYMESRDVTVTGKNAIIEDKNNLLPPHVKLGIENEKGEQLEWILAESFWANSFTLPNSTVVTKWLMHITPWVVFSTLARHLFSLFDKKQSSKFRTLISIVTFPFELTAILLMSLVILLVEFLLFIALIGSVIPIPFIQKGVQKLLRFMSSIIGDSYILSSSHINRTAIVSKVTKDLNWLASEVDEIILVGHSQGAAISYLVVEELLQSDSSYKKMKALVTVGSGLAKLNQLKKGQTKTKRNSSPILEESQNVLGLNILTLFILLLGVLFFLSPVEKTIGAGISLLFFTLFFGAIALAFAREVNKLTNTDIVNVIKTATRLGTDNKIWKDIYSGWDPVPNGPLIQSKYEESILIDFVEIKNTSTPMFDHTTYQTNIEEFYSELFKTIANKELPAIDLYLHKRAKYLRLRSVKHYEWQLFFLMLGPLLIILNQDAFISIGTNLITSLKKVNDLIGLDILNVQELSPLKTSIVVMAGIIIVLYSILNMLFERERQHYLNLFFNKKLLISSADIPSNFTLNYIASYFVLFISIMSILEFKNIYQPTTLQLQNSWLILCMIIVPILLHFVFKRFLVNDLAVFEKQNLSGELRQ